MATTQREIAEALLREAFDREERIRIRDVVAAGQAQGVSRTTMLRVARSMGARTVSNGPLPGYWERSHD